MALVSRCPAHHPEGGGGGGGPLRTCEAGGLNLGPMQSSGGCDLGLTSKGNAAVFANPVTRRKQATLTAQDSGTDTAKYTVNALLFQKRIY